MQPSVRQKPAIAASIDQVQVTLRELLTHLTQPIVTMALVSIVAVLALMDAFGLSQHHSIGIRLAYLTIMVWTTYAIGWTVAEVFGPFLKPRISSPMLRWPTQGALAGTFILGAVLLLNWIFFNQTPLEDLRELAPTVIGAATVITVTLEFACQQRQAANGTPPLMERLPYHLRGQLIALSAEDHYTRIKTEKGSHLLLIRLADAMRETDPTPGLQVHRSHWVAKPAVATATQSKGRATITLTDGTKIPVSRGRLSVLRDAGFLPKARQA